MHLSNYQNMDVNLLLSIVNMKLRNSGAKLTELCNEHEIDECILVARMAELGVSYIERHNQFKLI